MLDIGFDFTGQKLVTASADGSARCYNATTHSLISKMEGHEGEISKVSQVILTFYSMKKCSIHLLQGNRYFVEKSLKTTPPGEVFLYHIWYPTLNYQRGIPNMAQKYFI